MKVSDEQKNKIGRVAYIAATALAAMIAAWFGLTSCQVSRTVTTSAESYQKGDTSTIIQTKTIETYTGTKKAF